MDTKFLNVKSVSLNGIVFETDYIFHAFNPETSDISYPKKINLILKIFDGISFSAYNSFDLIFLGQTPNTNIFKYKLTSFLFTKDSLLLLQIMDKTDDIINDSSNRISIDFLQNYNNGLEVLLDLNEVGTYKINSLMINENIIPVNSNEFELYSLPASADVQIVADKDYLIQYANSIAKAKITLNGGSQTGGHEIVLDIAKIN